MYYSGSRFGRYLNPLMVSCVYLFLYLPIIILVVFSFNDGDFAGGWKGFSFRWYHAMVHSQEILAALRASLIVACSSTILSLVFGTCAVISTKWLRWERWLNVFYTNVLIPDIVLGIGLLCLFSLLNLPLGYKSLIVGHTVLGLGFVIPIVSSRFNQIDPILTEASLDLGATQWQTMRRVVLPLLTPGLMAAGLLVFTLSLDDFVISFFCAGTHVETLSVYVFNQIKNLIDPSINALSTCMLLISSLSVVCLAYLNILDEVVHSD
ncbi:MAG: spermidine/putrescine transport system permease protein [Candidatus Dependentiae bacterium]|nr:spermidine/putrescine transport system permease protein [Candidatus Dependentiae bacterium]